MSVMVNFIGLFVVLKDYLFEFILLVVVILLIRIQRKKNSYKKTSDFSNLLKETASCFLFVVNFEIIFLPYSHY